MEKQQYALGKTNFIWLGVSFLLIVIGFVLMGGRGTTESAFNPDIFSKTRIVIAPAICFIGFAMTIWAVIKKPNSSKNKD